MKWDRLKADHIFTLLSAVFLADLSAIFLVDLSAVFMVDLSAFSGLDTSFATAPSPGHLIV